jgi:hypothetical protein
MESIEAMVVRASEPCEASKRSIFADRARMSAARVVFARTPPDKDRDAAVAATILHSASKDKRLSDASR